jgi:hypothetical protein
MNHETKLYLLTQYGNAMRKAKDEMREASKRNDTKRIVASIAMYELKKRCYEEFWAYITISQQQ